MSLNQIVSENLGLIVGVLVFVLFVIGLVLALRTEKGRNSLAAGAVRVALAALALAEKWIGQQLEPAAVDAIGAEENEIVAARRWLHTWLDRR